MSIKIPKLPLDCQFNSPMKKILAFSGSNSSTSINQQLINTIAPIVKRVEIEILDLRDYPAEVFGVDVENSKGYPQSMLDFFEKMRSADGYLISVPEHNGSMPAVFKNSLDWISRMGGKIFNSKPTVFLSASPGGRGGASVLQHLNQIMPHRGAEIIGSHGIAKFKDKLIEGEFKDQEDLKTIEALIHSLEDRILSH